MYYIYDERGFKGDFGSLFTVIKFDDIAKEMSLPSLLGFLDDGYSLDIEGVKSDLRSLNFMFSDFEDIRVDLLSILDNCKGMIIISNGGENPEK